MIDTDRARPDFRHLQRLTDARGLFEHALHAVPRTEHGYCVDDTARALVVVCREPDPGPALVLLADQYLGFILSALDADGRSRNRMDRDGVWRDEPALGDWWGRALWGLGHAAAHGPTPEMRSRALTGFRSAARRHSPDLRATVFAALGAGELLLHGDGDPAAIRLLRDAVSALGGGGADPAWPWPEERLSYGNGSLVEALLLAGSLLPDPAVAARGIDLLDFLLRVETRDGRLSVTPVGGRGTGDSAPAFDQQPIEVAALADACARAYDLTGGDRWLEGVRMAWRWFGGDNDSGTAMADPLTGAGYDGLEVDGRNLNQGAESTLAALSTEQQARRLGVHS